MKNEKWKIQGFTLIELLVVISIIGILLGLSIFGLQGARVSSRDAKRKTDLELIRSGLEIYKADCNGYPLSSPTFDPALVSASLDSGGGQLVGDNSPTHPSCKPTNIYISSIPEDPTFPVASYIYWSNGITYELCSTLEKPAAGAAVVACGDIIGGVTTTSCASGASGGTASCYYSVKNP